MDDYRLTINGEAIDDDDYDDDFDFFFQPPSAELKQPEVSPRKEIKANEQKEIVKIYCTPQQKQKIKESAGGMSVSSWCRNTLLGEYNGKYQWEINFGDLDGINRELNEFTQHLNGILRALGYQQDIYASDIARIEKLLTETRNAVVEAKTKIMRDRMRAKKEMMATLREQLQDALEEQRMINTMDFNDNERGRKGRRK